MVITEAEDRLNQLLTENSFRTDTLALSVGWEAFKRFAREPIESSTSVIEVQIGVDTRTGSEASFVCCYRICEVNDEEKYYDHMETLGLMFLATPSAEIRMHATSLFSAHKRFPTLEDYFTAVENLPAFQAALAHSPWQCRLVHPR